NITLKKEEEVIDFIYNIIKKEYEEKIKDVPEEVINEFEKALSLRVIDTYWMEHINTMSHLREGIHLRSYGQEDPLRAYTMEGFDLFETMLEHIDKDITTFLLKAEIKQNVEREEIVKEKLTNDSDDSIKRKPKKVQKIGRNDLCPCGSGKKY
ncbi:MAG: SEC-C metal-binding domain-containing protein, partial [Bacilli bacterium]